MCPAKDDLAITEQQSKIGAILQVILPSPFLLENELKAIESKTGLKTETFTLHYQSGSSGALAAALDRLCNDVESAVRGGVEVLILSDRIKDDEIDSNKPPIPTLLAVGATHHHLIRLSLDNISSTPLDVEFSLHVTVCKVCRSQR